MASSAEIAAQEEFTKSKRQAQEAISWLEEDGQVDYVRDGREVRYYLAGIESLIPEDEREKYGL
jgi:DNA-binding transcriptional ArsR family regulator